MPLHNYDLAGPGDSDKSDKQGATGFESNPDGTSIDDEFLDTFEKGLAVLKATNQTEEIAAQCLFLRDIYVGKPRLFINVAGRDKVYSEEYKRRSIALAAELNRITESGEFDKYTPEDLLALIRDRLGLASSSQ